MVGYNSFTSLVPRHLPELPNLTVPRGLPELLHLPVSRRLPEWPQIFVTVTRPYSLPCYSSSVINILKGEIESAEVLTEKKWLLNQL